ncbi:MAG: HU family DNA-binding protein [Candidatus Midichloria sp.]|nr:MAG: HU family DNA-binding protein [Candidatus Midichloria sp.]
MNKTEFVAAIASSMVTTKSESEKFINSFITVVKKALQEGREIKLVGFGSYKVKDVPAKEVRNPQTGEKMKVPATRKPKFFPGSELKKAVNSGKKK